MTMLICEGVHMTDEDKKPDTGSKGTEDKKDSGKDAAPNAVPKDDSGIEQRIASLEDSFKTEVNRLNDAIAAMVANGATIQENNGGINNVSETEDSDEDTPLEDMDFKL